MEYQNFDCEIAEGCARICMTGPGSPQLADFHDEFVDLFLRLQEDRAVRVILFTDGDHAFELNHLQDEVSEAQSEGGGLEILAAIEEVSRNVVTLIGESTKPVLSATRGDVRDFGLGFFLASDIRLASPKASFTCQNMTTGVIAGWGLTHTLPQLIGPGRSLDFIWSHRTIGGEEAARIGLVDRLIDDTAWEQEIDAYIQHLTQLPQPAVRLTKLAVEQSNTMDFTTMLSVEWESQQQCWDSLETVEGLTAWRENRPPMLAVNIEDEDE